MSTSPVMTITAALLDNLQQKAKAAIDSRPPIDIPNTAYAAHMTRFRSVASPDAVSALVEHVRSLTERMDKMAAELKRWEPIHYEIERRAGKTFEWDGCDFQVTIMADDYAAIAQEGADHE